MGKRQDFIDLYRSGKGTRQKYIDLSGHGFRSKSLAVPIDPFRELMIYEMLMSGALPSELKHGGIASLAHGGRIGFHRGSLRHQKTHDWKSYQKEGPETWGLYGSPPENWLMTLLGKEKMGAVVPQRDALESFMKERFMYGEKPPRPNVFKEIWSDVKGLLNKKAKGGLAGILNL